MSSDNTPGINRPSHPEDGALLTGLIATMLEDDDSVQIRDQRLLRLAQQRREEALKALKKSRRAAIYPPSIPATVTADLSSNTQLPTSPAATPQHEGPGPSGLEYPMRGAGVEQFQRWTERMNTPPIAAPPIRRSSRNWPSPSRRQPLYFHADTPHPNSWRPGMPVNITTPRRPAIGLLEADIAFGIPSALFRGPYFGHPETPRFHARLRHLDAESMGSSTGLVTSSPSILAAPGESRQAGTDPIGGVGPSEVVMTGTRGAQHTMSAEEIFREVRECVIEYLGSNVEE